MLKNIGTCSRGKTCKFTHDPNHVAICQRYLLTGKCDKMGCPLSHSPNEFNSPSCSYYLMGKCANGENCKFTHSDNINLSSPTCQSFAYDGYCENGKKCSKRHAFDCPEFEQTGRCTRKSCKLKHITRNNKITTSNIKVSDSKKVVDINLLANSIFEGGKENEEHAIEQESESESSNDDQSDKSEQSELEQLEEEIDYSDQNESFIRV